MLKNNALEIFLTNGKTYLIACVHTAERDATFDKLLSLDLPNRIRHEDDASAAPGARKSMTQRVRCGRAGGVAG